VPNIIQFRLYLTKLLQKQNSSTFFMVHSVYISKRYLPGVFVWADCASDVIVIYDVIEH